MMLDDGYMGSLFTRADFHTEQRAIDFFRWMADRPVLFRPTRYGRTEAARHALGLNDLSLPVSDLLGPNGSGGGLFLKGAKHQFLLGIKWAPNMLVDWDLYGNTKLFQSRDRTNSFVQFVADLATCFPIEYGVIGPWDDWKAKHWIVKSLPHGGTSESKRGMTLETGLLSIQWLTVLGPQLVRLFNADALGQLPIFRTVPLSSGGVILQLREVPFIPENLDARIEQDCKITDLLGDNYFFDIRRLEKAIVPIPGLTGLISNR